MAAAAAAAALRRCHANATLTLAALAAAAAALLLILYADSEPPPSAAASLLLRSISTQRGPRACGADDDVSTQGRWVYDESSTPLYWADACPFVDDGFRCRESGRPDSGYVHWRWQPALCRLSRFDARAALERLRGIRVAFVGDSIGRNQWESLLCMLAAAVHNKSRVYEVEGQPISKHTGSLAFHLADYNCTIEYYRSPFLVPQTRPPPGAPHHITSVLRLDTVDWSSPRWVGAGVIVFNAAHWWNYEKTLRGGCFFSDVAGSVNLGMTVARAYERAVDTLLSWVEQHAASTPHLFFRTYSPVHFRDGTWKTGGQCHLETEPLQPEQQRQVGLEEDGRWTNDVLKSKLRKTRVQLLDITHLTDLRKDGHPSLWYKTPPAPKNRQDCSHWCLPGVPDTWNLLLLHKLGLLG